MKLLSNRSIIVAVLLVVAVCISLSNTSPIYRKGMYPSPNHSEVLQTEYNETCLIDAPVPVAPWECYEFVVDAGEHTEVQIRHLSGQIHRVLTFSDGEKIKFRFTPTAPGLWQFSTGGDIEVHDQRPNYAKGFIAAQGANWIRTATAEAFVPQFIMYDRPDVDTGLRIFIVDHGFTGFHIVNLRDFLVNPGYFEAVILKTYRLGGSTHFWIWGDETRNQTPDTYGVDSERLYQEIAARLAPLPGWTVGYGFDLFEWATAAEVEAFKEVLTVNSSYRHMIGARGHSNTYRAISNNLDYASWEWHRPDLDDYRDHIAHASGKPAFSEDRFRIRQPPRYPKKDYNFERTRRGLWESTIGGGVANIWGYKPEGASYSEPYPIKHEVKTYRRTIDKYFEVGMLSRDDVLEFGTCLEGEKHFLCFIRESDSDKLSIVDFSAIPEVTAIDTRQPFQESTVDTDGSNIRFVRKSDWAVVIPKEKFLRDVP